MEKTKFTAPTLDYQQLILLSINIKCEKFYHFNVRVFVSPPYYLCPNLVLPKTDFVLIYLDTLGTLL